jgi:beclin
MSFIMLTESQVQDTSGNTASPPSPPHSRRKKDPNATTSIDHAPTEDNLLSQKMETTTRLFEILSARSDIDHPICVECTDLLIDGLQRRLANATKERDAYVDFLRQANADVPSEEEVAQARSTLENARKREAAAFAELEALEAQKAALDEELLALEAESLGLDEKEEVFWAERNDFSVKLSTFQNERDRLTTQLMHDQQQLQRLQRCNVFNDTFSIGHDGFFGTINGLRLGRLPDKPVEWAEINAAWGHTCLLLATVSEKLEFKFKNFELRPMGSTSKIKQFVPPRSRGASNDPSHPPKLIEKTYELYSSGSTTEILSLGILHRKIDNAMVAFLECLRQLVVHAQSNQWETPEGRPVNFPDIPYKIEKDKIGEESIRLGGGGFGGNEEGWTRACKNTLTVCKYLLAHTSSVSDLRRREP